MAAPAPALRPIPLPQPDVQAMVNSLGTISNNVELLRNPPAVNQGAEILQVLRRLEQTVDGLGERLAASSGIQTAIPKLLNSESEGHFGIMRQWLKLCGNGTQHLNCQGARITPKCMLTRLVDVGHEGDQIIHLWKPSEDDATEYIASSRPWGHRPHFVTNVKNVSQHKKGIRLANLSTTFRDACRGGDFHQEATKMETAFSSASCVLTANRAHNEVRGFLGPRRERDYVTMQHALARCTIFFTEYQTYWECSDSVGCGTLTEVSNNLAAFLGDPKFPRIIMSAAQGEKIIRFQNLYKTYSALAFTNPCDRPIAMEGIQSRLLKAFGTRGGYGLGLLRRSLLWYQRNMKLVRIKFSFGKDTVTINFVKLKFGKINWTAIQSPWSTGNRAIIPMDNSSRRLALIGQARAITDHAEAGKSGKLYYNIRQEAGGDGVRCVVLGVEKGVEAIGARLHCFILVRPARSRPPGSGKAYERVGAEYLPGRFIATDGEKVQVY
ncbi:hypothetical protein GGR58DRAFT_529009 [Xylaria digitata]|nr:hypothetical protein GGR58DRAFT_529009 [Xylaria digitata]